MENYTVEEIKKAIEIIDYIYNNVETPSETSLDINGNRYSVFDVGSACDGMLILSDILRRKIGTNSIYSDVRSIEEAEAVG